MIAPRLGAQIDRYLARLILAPLVGTLCLAAILLLLDRMLFLFDFVVREGGPVPIVLRLFADLIPEHLAFAIPIGLTLGVLLAFRRLALTCELDTLLAAGVGYRRLLLVPYAYALLLFALNFWLLGFVQPGAEAAYRALRVELGSGLWGAPVRVGAFNRIGRGLTFRVERSENGGADLHGILLRMDGHDGHRMVVVAEQGRVLNSDEPGILLLRLANGRLVEDRPDYPAPRVLVFARHDIPVRIGTGPPARSGGASPSDEMDIFALRRIAADPGTAPRLRDELRANFHFRLTEVAMLLLLPLLAVALAVPPKRSASGLGFAVSIMFVIVYHKVDQLAEVVAAHGWLDPILALWAPFLVFAGTISWMFHVLANRPGAQPIGWLYRLAAHAARLVLRPART